jgi:hypothetical protein
MDRRKIISDAATLDDLRRRLKQARRRLKKVRRERDEARHLFVSELEIENNLLTSIQILQGILAEHGIPPPKVPRGRPGRPTYPREVRLYAWTLRREHPGMKTRTIWKKCKDKFGGDQLPSGLCNFSRWLRRPGGGK